MASEKKIKELLERDKAMPVKQFHFEAIKHEPVDICPVCETSLYWEFQKGEYPFCPKCGQRCDRSTIAL